MSCAVREGGKIVPNSKYAHPVMYQRFMRGVDVIDQLRTNYSVQLRSKKWWKKLFCCVVDQWIVNAYILYLEKMVALGLKPLDHMQFNLAIAHYLVKPRLDKPGPACPTGGRKPKPKPPCIPERCANYRRKCLHCPVFTKWYCAGCNYAFMCNRVCFKELHRTKNLR